MCRIRVILVWLILFISYFGLYAEPNDSTVLITATELKYTNFIFIEHKRLLVDNSLLKVQVNNYSNLYNQQLNIDTIRKEELDNCYNQINTLQNRISNQDKTIKLFKIGTISVSACLLLVFLFK